MDIYKLTPKARQALSIAKKEAQLLKNKYAGTEHLLLGLLNIGDSIVTEILEDIEIDIDGLRAIIYDNISQEGDSVISLDDISFTPRVEKVIEVAHKCATKLGRNQIDIEHVFLGLLYESDGVATNILESLDVSFTRVKGIIDKELGNESDTIIDDPPFQPVDEEILSLKSLQKFGTDLTKLAARSKIDPVIGREIEITRLMQVLCRKLKNNPVLVGEAGVGKTAVVEGLAQRIVKGNVPDVLLNKHIFSVDLSAMVAGTKYRGQFEERLKNVLRDIKRSKNIIVFLDEIHIMVGAGSAEGAMDASNMLKPALARGELRCIGATTPREFKKTIEKDSALERRFQPVKISEPTNEESLQILIGIKTVYEKFHHVTYTDEALHAAIKLSVRYLTDRNLPDKAIDLIDEAGATNHPVNEYSQKIKQYKGDIQAAKKKKENLIKGQQFEEACKYRDKEKVAAQELEQLTSERKSKKKQAVVIDEIVIQKVVTNITGIPVVYNEDTGKKVMSLDKKISKEVIGQDGAIKAITDSLLRSAANLQDPRKPTGAFLFIGPTGVGKTYLAKILSKHLYGSEEDIIQVDMSEMMEQHSVSKILGSPPGYVGYDEGGKLTEQVKRNPYSLVLFDEIEKAHPEVLNTLLQILEEGKVTDSLGREINFRNTIIVMTTNIGADKVQQPIPMGFSNASEKEQEELRSSVAIDEVKKNFKLEFVNRIGSIVVFNKLTKPNLLSIIDIQFSEYSNRIKENHNINVTLHKTARELFLEEGYDDKFGARELKRAIQNLFETSMAKDIITEKYKDGDSIVCYAKDSTIKFRKKATREKNENS